MQINRVLQRSAQTLQDGDALFGKIQDRIIPTSIQMSCKTDIHKDDTWITQKFLQCDKERKRSLISLHTVKYILMFFGSVLTTWKIS